VVVADDEPFRQDSDGLHGFRSEVLDSITRRTMP
jgi:hypothetical protein